jgi:membrane-bound lytic murein transglycosylase D
VRRGDTLVTIADRFGVTLNDLRHWNHVRGNSIGVGRRLRVAAPAVTEETSTSRRSSKSVSARRSTERKADPPESAPSRKGHSASYRVRRGDTLGAIAARFGVSTADLRRWNHLRGNIIRAGAVLLVAVPGRH